MRRYVRRAVTALGLVLTGCRDAPDQPAAPKHPQPATSAAIHVLTAPTINELYTRISTLSPGFGGLYIDSTRTPVFYHKYPAKRSEAIAAIHYVLGSPWQFGGNGFRIVQGRFDFGELESWRAALESVGPANLAGVSLVDIDERINRIYVGVDDVAVQARLLSTAAFLGIPREAIVINVAPRPTPSQSTVLGKVDEKYRPLVGGLQVLTGPNPSTAAQFCSLGFIVRFSTDTTRFYAVTASHCSASMDYADGYYMGQISMSDSVAQESVDPGYWGGVGQVDGCISGFVCRNADASLWRILPNVARTDIGFGNVARVDSAAAGYGLRGGKTMVSPHNSVVGEETYLPAGTYLYKMGGVSGWTGGTVRIAPGEVTRTCTDFYSGGNKMMPCQWFARIWVEGGDSGGPVFVLLPNYQIHLAGVLHSGYYASPDFGVSFSTMDRIRADLGNFLTY